MTDTYLSGHWPDNYFAGNFWPLVVPPDEIAEYTYLTGAAPLYAAPVYYWPFGGGGRVMIGSRLIYPRVPL